MPWADVLYGCDEKWWNHHNGVPGFDGEKWSSHQSGGSICNDKLACAERYGLNLIAGSEAPGFSLDPSVVHYGCNSGFQALNLAILWGASVIVLVGFDMRRVDGAAHFFGEHPASLSTPVDYSRFVPHFERAEVPEGVQILNATPESALACYPVVDLGSALHGH
jgi:hypothetical protein